MATITLSDMEMSIIYSAISHHHNILRYTDLKWMDDATQECFKKEAEITEKLRDRILQEMAKRTAQGC